MQAVKCDSLNSSIIHHHFYQQLTSLGISIILFTSVMTSTLLLLYRGLQHKCIIYMYITLFIPRIVKTQRKMILCMHVSNISFGS
jgi:hypothetical protein